MQSLAKVYTRYLKKLGFIKDDVLHELDGDKIGESLLNWSSGGIYIKDAHKLLDYPQVPNLDYVLKVYAARASSQVLILAGPLDHMVGLRGYSLSAKRYLRYEMIVEDLTERELLEELGQELREAYGHRLIIQGTIVGKAASIVANRLCSKQRSQAWNGGCILQQEVNNIKLRRLQRVAKQSQGLLNAGFCLTENDLLSATGSVFERIKGTSAWRELHELVGVEMVKQQVAGYVQTVEDNIAREMKGKPPTKISLSKVFLGNPGTGKTTVAKLYGQILKELGLLGGGEVVYRTSVDFIAPSTAEVVRSTMEALSAAQGGILIIDGFYILGKILSNGHPNHAKEAIVDTIVNQVQNDDDRCVILIGYEDEMRKLFRTMNKGLYRHFPLENAFVFGDYTQHQISQILDFKLKEEELTMSNAARTAFLAATDRARRGPHFSNADQVRILLDSTKERRLLSCLSDSSLDASLLAAADVDPDYDRIETVFESNED